MQTTVTGVFPNPRAASIAAQNLVQAGFPAHGVRVVDGDSPFRHAFVHAKTADAKRAAIMGLVSGAILGVGSGLAFASVFGLLPATVVGGCAGAIGGAALGLAVGRSTASQLRDELEHQMDAGTVLVSVTADESHRSRLLELLAGEGGTSLVSTATSFTAGVLPASPG